MDLVNTAFPSKSMERRIEDLCLDLGSTTVNGKQLHVVDVDFNK